MHLGKEKVKPRFQIRLLEFEKDGVTFKKNSKNSNIYPNADNLTIEKIWKRIEKAINGKGDNKK